MLKSLCLGIFIFLLSTAGWAQQLKFVSFLHQIDGSQIVGNGVFAGTAPSVEDLARDLGKFSSDTDFFDYLVQRYPQFRENYILVHSSQSQQLSSLQHPRVILFGAGSAFAFSDDPLQRERRVEILLAQPDTYKVTLHEIKFSGGRASLESNPKSCLACHGSPSRALWNPYDFWPNSFASAVGVFSTQREKQSYSWLVKNSSSLDFMRRLSLPVDLSRDNENVTAFTQFVAQLNIGRWIKTHLVAGSAFDGFAKPVIGVLGCYSNNSFAEQKAFDIFQYIQSDEVKPSLPLLSKIRDDQRESREHFKNLLDQDEQRIFGKSQFLAKVDHSRLESEVEPLSIMRWIFEMAGVDSRDMSSSLIGNDTLISTPSNFQVDFLTSLYELRPDLFGDIKLSGVDLYLGQKHWVLPDCDSLKQASLQESRKVTKAISWKPYSYHNQARPVVSRCSRCHVEQLSDPSIPVPEIPFDDPAKFARLLRAPGSTLAARIHQRIRDHGKDQMPPDHPLNADEVEALDAYVQNLQ